MGTNDMMTVALAEDVYATLNGRTVFDEPGMVYMRNPAEAYRGPDGKVPAGHAAKDDGRSLSPYPRRPVSKGVIADHYALKALLTHIAELAVDEQATVALVLLVVPDSAYKLDRTMLKETAKEVWGKVQVVVVPESQVAGVGADQPLWDARGVALSLLTPTYTTCALYSSGTQVASVSHAKSDSSEVGLRQLIDAARDSIGHAGPGAAKTIRTDGLVVISDVKEISSHQEQLKKELSLERVIVHPESAKTAVRTGIKAYESKKQDLLTHGFMRPAQ